MQALPSALTILLGLAAAIVVVLGARELGWLIGPVFLALVIVLLLHPLHTSLRHKTVPEGVALVALLLAIFGVLIVVANAIFLLSLMLFLGSTPPERSAGGGGQPTPSSPRRRLPDLLRQHPPVPGRDHDPRNDHRLRRYIAAALVGHPAHDLVGRRPRSAATSRTSAS